MNSIVGISYVLPLDWCDANEERKRRDSRGRGRVGRLSNHTRSRRTPLQVLQPSAAPYGRGPCHLLYLSHPRPLLSVASSAHGTVRVSSSTSE
jgi:hypothetical protein